MPHYFTPNEANDLLAEIRPLAEELVAHRRAYLQLQQQRAELAQRIAGNGGGIDSQRLSDLEAAEERERIGIARTVNAIHGHGAIVKDPVQDRVVWLEYLQTVVKERDGWKDLYRSCQEVL